MQHRISLQDILCRYNIWHRYTDWQYDTRTTEDRTGIHLVQARFCFNCSWRKCKEVPLPKITGIRK